MLPLLQDENLSVSIVGIDPGTETLGVSVLSFDPCTFEITAFEAYTFYGSKLSGSEWTSSVFNDRAKRIEAHHANLLSIFRRVMPVAIACESPFFSRLHPGAYGALTEVVCACTQAVKDYDVWRPLTLVDPPTVKKAVGAPGNADKDKVKQCLAAIPSLMKASGPSFLSWDEHSVDAGCVAYWRYLSFVHPR